LEQDAVRAIFSSEKKIKPLGITGSEPKRQRRQVLVAAACVPQNRTLRIWASRYFEEWAASQSDGAPYVCKGGGSWTEKTVGDFFKAKDQEFNRLSGETLVQLRLTTTVGLHIKISKTSSLLILSFQGQEQFRVTIASTSVATNASPRLLPARMYSTKEGNQAEPHTSVSAQQQVQNSRLASAVSPHGPDLHLSR
jgi:hypothetical protein